MIHEVFMPALSSTMTEGKVVSWTKATGDKVEKGETLVVVESDKADMEVESFQSGYLALILTPVGETAPVGATIGYLAETTAEIPLAQSKAPRAPAAAVNAPPAVVERSPEPVRNHGRVIASPRARKLAQTLGVDLSKLQGSGPHGRVVAADVEGIRPVSSTPPPLVAPAPKPSTPQVTAPAGGWTTAQQAVIRNMNASLEVPTFRVGYTITTDALEALSRQLKPKGVTMTALLAKAVALTLGRHPRLNWAYTPQGPQQPATINVAVAVAMEDGGLITPVLAQADQLDIYSLSRTWKDLVERARTKQLQPAEYTTGTFTISNLGMFGVDRFDAILPPNQGAILAVGASRPQVVATREGLLGVRSQMQVNLTCDHRVIYGAHGAAFLQDLAQLLETSPQSLTL